MTKTTKAVSGISIELLHNTKVCSGKSKYSDSAIVEEALEEKYERALAAK